MLQTGDTIVCNSRDDLIETMIECAKAGVETEFDYSNNDFRLVVTEVKEDE